MNERTLMLSECQGVCCSCFNDCDCGIQLCPSRYAYWWENPDFNSPHNLHISEKEARALAKTNKVLAAIVQDADNDINQYNN